MGDTAYDVYVVVESSANPPVLGTVMKVNVNTRAAVSAANVLPTTADIDVLSGTAGTAYVAVLADGAAAPTAAAIKAATAGMGGVVAADNSAVTAGTRTTFSLTGLTSDTAYDVYVVIESGGVLGTVTKVDLTTPMRLADADSDGLIEIGTLAELNNVRHNLAGTTYRVDPNVSGDTGGCPAGVCRGYELTADLTFDEDGDGSSWTRKLDGSVTLDTGDDNDDYFDVDTGGWVPIGEDRSNPFTAVFEGNGHTITGLATARNLTYIGLFGGTSGAEIRNLGLVDNLARKTGTGSANVGSLVGEQLGGSTITASHATGDVDGGAGIDTVGGLVGQQHNSSTITASWASGNVDGGAGNDTVGGLVGDQLGGSITASYATGDADGGAGSFQKVGGLVGRFTGTITASYATGDADGGDGSNDQVGGLAGSFVGTITASYATGDADGGAGSNDQVGSLVGYQVSSTITASWGFGSKAGGETAGVDGSDDLPLGVRSLNGFIATNVPAAWNEAASNTLGAWNFGTASQPPRLNYADYDGATVGTAGAYTSGHLFHCASDSANAPEDAILIPDCGTLIPGVAASNVLAVTADITVLSGRAGTAYIVALADGAMAPTAFTIKIEAMTGGRFTGGCGCCRQRGSNCQRQGNRQPDGTHGRHRLRCLCRCRVGWRFRQGYEGRSDHSESR